MALIDIDKFLASFITEMKKYQPITCYNLPGCIKKALEDQGLEYKDGEIVRISVESEDERIKKLLIDGFKRYDDGALFNGCSVREILPWLEKQGKPKFKVGDWITNEDLNIVGRIDEINKDKTYYNISYVKGLITFNSSKVESTDTNFHLWSIEDAKPGDVLAFDDNNIVMFKNLYNETTFHSYCHIENGLFDVNNDEIPDWWEGKGFHPATKEQRDILFQKMHEAGYTFDFEKKELKKLKFRVGDEVITENEESLTITRIDEEGYWSNDLFICDFDSECIWDLVEQKSAEWSEEAKEVDLEKTLTSFQNFYAHENSGEFPSAIEIAKHFYKLGLKAKGE